MPFHLFHNNEVFISGIEKKPLPVLILLWEIDTFKKMIIIYWFGSVIRPNGDEEEVQQQQQQNLVFVFDIVFSMVKWSLSLAWSFNVDDDHCLMPGAHYHHHLGFGIFLVKS